MGTILGEVEHSKSDAAATALELGELIHVVVEAGVGSEKNGGRGFSVNC